MKIINKLKEFRQPSIWTQEYASFIEIYVGKKVVATIDRNGKIIRVHGNDIVCKID